MNVFISWSGERSKAVGLLLNNWLQCVIQAIRPWMSNKDIDRGSLWFSEITGQLKETSIGIVCLTQENKNKPWILFEAGALAKGLSSNRVCTVLIDLKPSDIEDPLAQFNHTTPERESMFNLVSTLNNVLGENGLNTNVLEEVFSVYWPTFETKFEKIINETPETSPTETRSSNDILSEILYTTRTMDRRIRHLESPSNRLTRGSEDFEVIKRSRSELVELVESLIKNMVSDNMQDDDIIELIRGRYKIPRKIIYSIIKKYRKDNDSGDSKLEV